MLGWIIREASRATLDRAGILLDHAASALHRAAGEPSAVDEMRRERDDAIEELDDFKAKALQTIDCVRDERDAAAQAISDLYDYATDAADLDSLDGATHMPTRIKEAIDALTEKRDEAFQVERDALERARLCEAETGRWKEREAATRAELDGARQRLWETESTLADERVRCRVLTRERDEARAECERYRNGIAVGPDQGGAG